MEHQDDYQEYSLVMENYLDDNYHDARQELNEFEQQPTKENN